MRARGGRAEDARRGPRGKQPAVDGADELRAEDVGEIGRHRREAAAVHRQDDAEEGDEQGQATGRRGGRDGGVERAAELVVEVFRRDARRGLLERG